VSSSTYLTFDGTQQVLTIPLSAYPAAAGFSLTRLHALHLDSWSPAGTTFLIDDLQLSGTSTGTVPPPPPPAPTVEPGTLVIDDFSSEARYTVGRNALQGFTSDDRSLVSATAAQQKQNLELVTRQGGYWYSEFAPRGAGCFDAGKYTSLSMRVQGAAGSSFRIVLEGQNAACTDRSNIDPGITSSAFITLDGTMQTLNIPLTAFAATGFTLSKVHAMHLDTWTPVGATFVIDDLAFVGADTFGRRR